jgi:hypothetical protein
MVRILLAACTGRNAVPRGLNLYRGRLVEPLNRYAVESERAAEARR